MNIEQIQREVWYYLGIDCSTEEAAEIQIFADQLFAEGSRASFDEIISDYYNC